MTELDAFEFWINGLIVPKMQTRIKSFSFAGASCLLTLFNFHFQLTFATNYLQLLISRYKTKQICPICKKKDLNLPLHITCILYFPNLQYHI